jgi:tRNA threonylcarbamoyl adenosine modification protein (Sua5/YciO/YrdC/YwlC family)
VGANLTSLDAAASIIERGGIVVVPTETVYGIAGKPEAHVVDRIFAVKQRPPDKSIQLLVPGAEWLDRLAHPSSDARLLAATFWPGPLTLVTWARADAPSAVVSDGTIGLRVPANQTALDLLERCGPLAASSANRSGDDTPPTADGVRAVLGDAVDGYLDGGTTSGAGSTVVNVTTETPDILRAGPITAQMLSDVLRGRFEDV